MPLAFRSRSHGVVAFGYFNIRTDLLLLDHLFLFTDRFCRGALAVLLPPPGAPPRTEVDGWRIDDPRRLGSLDGAISGRDLHGFLGDSYRRWPFPERRADFRQDPDGERNRQETEALVLRWGTPLDIPLVRRPDDRTVTLGATVFDDDEFLRLVAYVDRGGLPRWRDDRRPDVVADLMRQLHAAGIVPEPFDPRRQP
ncbi:MAG: hypothetical protein HY905_07015 [Deltaproteobacteria bacterium]|nr:hypothetical protein [Deltaproteobacteria bacterium]